MKVTLKSLVAIGALPLILASCSDDPTVKNDSEKVLVTITAQVGDGTETRAFADGSTAQRLHYAVYEHGSTQPLAVFENGATEATTAINLSTTVKLQLASGKTYDVAFFADAATDSPYTFNADGQTVDVAYTAGATTYANAESRDAFYKVEEVAVTGNTQKTVTLTRPFAQLNIGTDDIAASTSAGFAPTKTEVKVAVGNKLNLADGTIEGVEERTFELAAIPNGEVFPVAGYDYLSMNYLLVPEAKTVDDVKLTVADATGSQTVSRTYTNVPLQRNYRTNIYGSLLTNDINCNVVIEPAFLGSLGVSTDDQLAAAAAHANRHIGLADNVSLMMPATIAEGVVIEGGTNSILKVKNGYQQPNDNVTFRNLTIARDDSFGDSDGCYFKVNANGVVLDNVKFGIINPTSDSYVGGGVYVGGGKTITIKNTNITFQAAYSVFSMDPGTTFVFENCEIGLNTQYATNQPSSGKIIAKNTIFHGWMSGWADGYFENCKFEYGNLWYPYAGCYGSTTFKECEFQKLSTATDDRWLPTAPDRESDKQYDYAVSCMKRHSIIEFIDCRYSNGAAFDKNVFLKGTEDASGDPDKVIINGVTYTDMSEFTYW